MLGWFYWEHQYQVLPMFLCSNIAAKLHWNQNSDFFIVVILLSYVVIECLVATKDHIIFDCKSKFPHWYNNVQTQYTTTFSKFLVRFLITWFFFLWTQVWTQVWYHWVTQVIQELYEILQQWSCQMVFRRAKNIHLVFS